MKEIDFWVNLMANAMTILASGIAIFVFYFNRDKIKSAINFILNYSNQLTLTDLKFKIERLNDFNAGDITQKNEVVNILHEIEGQINGNSLLKVRLKEQLDKVTNLTVNSRTLTEPKKRSIVSELRESIRNIDASNYDALINSKNNN